MTEPLDLYELLPSVHRLRDAGRGYPLRALLALVSEQANVVRADIDRLEDDLFIETCAEWVVPYIGDLVANQPLYEIVQPRRADVANTIAYRRRKGTHAMLEQLAADVTGWSACVVEFFERLGWTQNQNHRRPASQWFDLRRQEACTRIGEAFDGASRSVDVRPLAGDEGWFGVSKLGFFLFRSLSLPVVDVPARASAVPWGFRFDPLGARAPLFQRVRTPDGRVTELDVAAAIRRERVFVDLEAAHAAMPPAVASELYGDFAAGPAAEARASLHVEVDGTAVPASRVVCARLFPWPAAPPSGDVVAVDVEHGRLALGAAWPTPAPAVDVSYHRGFPAPLGGGSYARTPFTDPNAATLRVREGATPTGPSGPYPSLDAALAVWRATTPPLNTVVRIEDSRTYALTGPLAVAASCSLVIEAASGERPLLVTGGAGVSAGSPTLAPLSALRFDGVALEGFVHVSGDLGKLRFEHVTLVPGRALDDDGEPATSGPSVVVEASAGGNPINTLLDIELARTISGPLRIPETIGELTVTDCVLDGVGGAALSDPAGVSGPRTTLEQVTLLGATLAHELFASNCVFSGRVNVDRLQQGCVRFSWLSLDTTPPGRAPRRYRCQPELAVENALEAALKLDPTLDAAAKAALTAREEARVVPSFVARRFGHPAYAELAPRTPAEIRTGADDESEMGAYQLVHAPQRESNLRVRLAEYVPFGLEFGLIAVT